MRAEVLLDEHYAVGGSGEREGPGGAEAEVRGVAGEGAGRRRLKGMDASLQERVLAFVSEQTGAKREKIHLETTLSGDLGVEGDDAVEFFEEFRTKFAVDLQELGRDWSFYFGPEGLPLSASIIIIIPPVLIGLALTRMFPRVPEWLWFITAFVSWMFLLVLWGNWRERNALVKRPQVMVQDLIDCAHSGVWMKAIPADAVKKFGQNRPYGGLGSWFTR